jgi:hypothetical protein
VHTAALAPRLFAKPRLADDRLLAAPPAARLPAPARQRNAHAERWPERASWRSRADDATVLDMDLAIGST